MTKEEAIKHLHTYSSTNGSGLTTQDQHEEAKKMAIKALETQLQWTPCSVQLPTLGIRYTVTYESGEVGYADFRNKVIYGNKYIENVWDIPEYYEDDGQVVAWMPRPQSWKGGQGNGTD